MKNFRFLIAVLFTAILILTICFLNLRELNKNTNVLEDLSKNWTITYGKKSYVENFKYTNNPKMGKNKYITVSKCFNVPRKYKDMPIILKFDLVSSSYTLYVNGNFIGKSGDFPPAFSNGKNNINYYVLSPQILNYDKVNIIELKYYVSYECGFKVSPLLLSYSYGEKLYNIQKFFNYTYYIVLSSLLFCISIIFAFCYKKCSTEKYMKYFSCISMLLAIYYQGFTLYHTSLDYLVYQKIIYSSLYMAYAIMPMFLKSYFNVKSNIIDKGIIAYQFLVILASLFLMNLNTYMKFTTVYPLVLILYDIYFVFICIRAYNATKSPSCIKFAILSLLTFISCIFSSKLAGLLSEFSSISLMQPTSLITLIVLFIVAMNIGDKLIQLQIEIINNSKRIQSTNLVLEKIINDNKELYSKTIRDELTGLYNRFYLIQYYKNQLSFLSDTSKMALIFIDIDNFRDYNNNFGHAAGDYIIKFFSTEVSKLIKEGEIFSRFGGDEFCILTCFRDQNRPLQICEAIKDTLDNNTCFYEKTTINLTCSMGISLVDDYVDFEVAVGNADKAMYDVKNTGKNNFCLNKIHSSVNYHHL